MTQANRPEFTAAHLPDFLVLGTQKGGTTTLHHLLRQHPDVFLPSVKEVHFFSLHYGKGAAWYGEHFRGAQPQQRCGEITPYYLFHPEAPGRIHQLLPKARLIILLRDPVERLLSQYFHSRRLGKESLPLGTALAAERRRLGGAEAVLAEPLGRHPSHQEHSYLSRSRYEDQLERYEALFVPEQILVLRSEDLFLQPDLVWRKLLDFLELAPRPIPQDAARLQANAGESEAGRVSTWRRWWLRRQLRPTYVLMGEHYQLHWP